MMLRVALGAALAVGPVAQGVNFGAASAQTAEAPKPEIRKDVAAYLEARKAHPMPPLTRETLTAMRAMGPQAAAAMASGDLPVGEMAVQREVTMPGPGGPLRLKLFDTREDRGPGPVFVFYHGGGYIFGSIETHAGLAAEIARQLDLPVISVDYRLAPEHPWPAAIDDGVAAARWIAANGSALGLGITGLVLGGDSAGGNLTLVAAAELRDKPATVPVLLQVPIYPVTDFTKTYPSQTEFAEGYGLDASSTKLMSSHYAADPKSLRASPLLGDLRGLPPTVLVTASLDPLRDQGRAYGAKLVEAGVPVAFYEGKGLIHGFSSFRKAIPSAQTDTLAYLQLARAMLDTPSGE